MTGARPNHTTIWRAALLAVVGFSASPANADQFSYQNAFDQRVTDPSNRSALDNFVREAVNQGQYDQALSTLEEIIFRQPNAIGARLALARIYFQIQAYDVAAAHLEQAALTPGSEVFAKEIKELQARIKRAQSGYEYRLTASAGVDYKSVTQKIATVPDETRDLVSPYAMIDGVVIHDLDTASNDEIRIGGIYRYKRQIGDIDFDNALDTFDTGAGRVYVTYSKGLPDIIDTLRVEVTGFGDIQQLGSDRQVQEYGANTEIRWQPTVESQVRLFAGYGWLGNSTNFYTEHRARYGASGEVRVAPGVAVGAHASGYTDWGTSPLAFTFGGTDFGFTAQGAATGLSVSHLLWVFKDGQSWIQEAGVRYTRENILDYASLASFAADMVDREAWEVFWDHTVQIYTKTELGFGVSYGQEAISDADIAMDRKDEYWGVKAGLTVRFN